MRKVIAGMAFAAGLTIAGQAMAETYRFFSTDSQKQTAFFLNSDRTTKVGLYHSVWYTAVKQTPELVDGQPVKYQVMRAQIDCEGGRLKIVAAFSYTGTGSVVKSYDDVSGWLDVPPQSMGDAMSAIVCRGGTRYTAFELTTDELLTVSDRFFEK